jgi:hypothetical protein
MFRRFSYCLVIVAALLVAEPLLHNHPLQQNNIPNACAICATGVSPMPVIAPSVAAPVIVVYTLAAAPVTTVTDAAAIAIASRAPPA